LKKNKVSEFDGQIVKDPVIFQQNSIMPHSDHEFYSSEAAAEEGGFSDFKVCLNGLWKFAYAKNPSLVLPRFYASETDCHDWDEIRVPAHIQMEGYDLPQYANYQYPWEGNEDVKPGEIPVKFNPTAQYVKYFTLPDFMKGRPVYISFQGVESGIALWLNGHYVGYREDTFTPSEFELTPYLQEGENKLAAEVFKWTAGSWCEDQDFFRFSGIFRDVYLFTVPDVHVRDLHISALPDDTMKDGRLSVDLSIGNPEEFRPFTEEERKGRAVSGAEEEAGEVTGSFCMRLLDADGKTAAESEGELREHTRIEASVSGVQLWSAENPYLYTCELKIYDKAGALQEVIREKTGFRRFEIKNSLMLLNGKRLLIHGVDRHEFGCLAGRVLTQEEIRQDIFTMKRNNINAIRTSHYPNQTMLYRLCDEYGIYVLDEANLETHGTWAIPGTHEDKVRSVIPGDRPEYQELILDRGRNMVFRDRNHACVIIWSLGNESYGGKDLYVMSQNVRAWDSSRPVHYEGVFRDLRYPGTSDIMSSMYTPADKVREYLKEHRDKPYISCEYSHAMGNSCGGIRKYTDLAWEEPLYQGGFIWDYIDQSLTMRDRNGREFQGYGGDHGERPTDYNFSGNGIAYAPDRAPSPKMQEVRHVYQNFRIEVARDSFTIRNGSLFTNSDACDCFVSLMANGVEIRKEKVVTDTAPQTEKKYGLPFVIPDDGKEYVVTVSLCLKRDEDWAEAGYEMAWGQGVSGEMPQTTGEEAALPNRNAIQSFAKTSESVPKLTVTAGHREIGVSGDHFRVMFSSIAGGLVSYRWGGEELLTSDVPRPNFWRPLTDNDRGCLLPFRAGQWQTASEYSSAKIKDGRADDPYELTKEEDKVTVAFTLHLPVRPALDARLVWTVFPDGHLHVKLTLPKSDEVGELPELSMLFAMDAQYDQIQWYGRGPEETYVDRKGGKLGIYRSTASDSFAKYLVPQECGWKEDVRVAEVTNRLGRGLRFVCHGLGFSALPYSPAQIDAAQHSNELPPVLRTYIRVGMQMGVGGDDSWGAQTHPEDRLKNDRPLSIEFDMKGI
jgi:beta-galactosidase